MKRNTARWLVVLAVVLIVYNVVVFAVPFEKTGVFFLSWIFTLAAIFAQAYVVHTAFYRGADIKSKFYGWPIARIGILYLALQTAAGLIFMGLGGRVSLWIPLVLYVLLLGLSVVGFVAADATRDEVSRQDQKQRSQVLLMRDLQSRVAALSRTAQDGPVRGALEQFSENLRFSDPVSGEALRNIERDLTACIDALQQAVMESNPQNAIALIQKGEALLVERNRLCKGNK